MQELPAWAWQLLTAAGGAASVYAAIRADLARLHERATHAIDAAEKAHSRIDQLTMAKR